MSHLSANEIEEMFQSLHGGKGPKIAPVKYQQLQVPETQRKSTRDIQFLSDVELTVDVELGSTQLSVREILELTEEMVLTLDCLAGDPVKIDLNGVPFGRGEIVVINEYFGVRITELANDESREEKHKE
ncbi:MAG: hypothetical protein GX262_01045 [Clostridia bacterium]|nr:hypothetical protein [Clostridia bacterium]